MGTVYNLDVFRRTGSREAAVITAQTAGILLSSTLSYKPELPQLDEFGFDSSIITALENRFGSQQPPKGVIYTNPVSGMKIDAYGWGNCNNSVFQYKPKKITNYNWNRPMPFPADLNKIYTALKKNAGKQMILGNKSEPLMWMDSKYGVCKAIIRAATYYKVQLIIKTMSDLGAREDYIGLIKEGNHIIHMNMSLGYDTPRIERLLSPGAPSYLRRTNAIRNFQQWGITIVRCEYSLPDTLEVRKRLGYSKNTPIQSIIKDLEEPNNILKKV